MGLVFLAVLPSIAAALVTKLFPSVPSELVFGLGLLASPVFLGALMYAYEDLFSNAKSPTSDPE